MRIGKDTSWIESTKAVHDAHPFSVSLNNEIFSMGSLNNNVYKWNKEANQYEFYKDLGYKRHGYSHIGTVVPLDAGLENWCLSNIRCATSNTTEDKSIKADTAVAVRNESSASKPDSFWNIFK